MSCDDPESPLDPGPPQTEAALFGSVDQTQVYHAHNKAR